MLRAKFGADVPLDLVTCYEGAPGRFAQNGGAVYDVNNFRGRHGRFRLLRQLRARRYPIVGIVCSGERILGKWKWVIAAALPAKILVINENVDCFWVDRGHWGNIRGFVKHRAGLADAGIVRTFASVAAFPFIFLYLLLYATVVHLRRALHRGFR